MVYIPINVPITLKATLFTISYTYNGSQTRKLYKPKTESLKSKYGISATFPESKDILNKYAFFVLPSCLILRRKENRSNVRPPIAYPSPTNREYTCTGRTILVAKEAIASYITLTIVLAERILRPYVSKLHIGSYPTTPAT